eukprot:jgi/Psemu1/42851/gm1.42851_g
MNTISPHQPCIQYKKEFEISEDIEYHKIVVGYNDDQLAGRQKELTKVHRKGYRRAALHLVRHLCQRMQRFQTTDWKMAKPPMKTIMPYLWTKAEMEQDYGFKEAITTFIQVLSSTVGLDAKETMITAFKQKNNPSNWQLKTAQTAVKLEAHLQDDEAVDLAVDHLAADNLVGDLTVVETAVDQMKATTPYSGRMTIMMVGQIRPRPVVEAQSNDAALVVLLKIKTMQSVSTDIPVVVLCDSGSTGTVTDARSMPFGVEPQHVGHKTIRTTANGVFDTLFAAHLMELQLPKLINDRQIKEISAAIFNLPWCRYANRSQTNIGEEVSTYDSQGGLAEAQVVFNGDIGCYPHRKTHVELEDDAKPIHMKPYSVPYQREEILKKELASLLNNLIK